MKALSLAFGVISALACTTTATMAAETVTLHVKPTTIILAPGQNAAVITISNEGGVKVNAQVRVFAWDQAQNHDELTETSTLVASPPMAALAPGQNQSIRVVRVDKSPVTREETYRVVVDEIPDKTSTQQVGVQVKMRYSLPVFVQPANQTGAIQMHIAAQVQGSNLVLTAQNTGQAHAQATNVTLGYEGGRSSPLTNGLLGYVLPGKSMQWTIPLPPSAGTAAKPSRVTASFNGQPFDVTL